jgi:hypothetical protein
MTESEIDDARRQVKQRLESLLAAGMDRIPRPPLGTTPKMRPEPADSTTVMPDPPPATRSAPKKSAAAPPPPLVLSSNLFTPSPIESGLPVLERPARLAELALQVSVCVRCPNLASTRTRTVFGEGSPTARLMFIGEGPGAEEDRTGRPFVGKAGMLLTDMITKGMGLTREEVYIANVVKSRPLTTDPQRTSDNRPPRKSVIACPTWKSKSPLSGPSFSVCLAKRLLQRFWKPRCR